MPATPFIGQIIPWAPNFAPRGWAFCDGQLLAISQNDALFAILGTIYGGDGRTTFALPDLRGRVAVHAGNGPGLNPIRLGQRGGEESVRLTLPQLPSHTHVANSTLRVAATRDDGTHAEPAADRRLAAAKLPTGHDANVWHAPSDVTLGGLELNGNVATIGGGAEHTNIQPTLAIRYIIALVGVFPSRA